MIVLQQITLSRGGRDLLSKASASVVPGSRVALVGRNGCGKTSLFSAIRGEITLDAGGLELMGQAIAWVDQAVPNTQESAHHFAMGARPMLAQAFSALAEGERSNDGEAMANAHHTLADLDAYRYPSQVAELLSGLGFDTEAQAKPVNAFSGGWKMRLALAKALLADAPILLLDEPTNHLDLDAIIWLEDYLRRFEGTVFLISHDRDFVDNVATHVLSFAHLQLKQYAGGYSDFERARAQEQTQQEQAARKHQEQVAHLTKFIDRFRAKATKAKQVQSRIKALERLGNVSVLREPDAPNFQFADVGPGPDPLLQAEGVVVGYAPGFPIVGPLNLVVKRAERIGLLGRNGAGKSTLLRSLVGQLPLLSGEITIARGLRVGYFAQDAVESLRDDESALQQIARNHPKHTMQEIRDFLGTFGVVGQRSMEPVGPMSGGERARIALANIALEKPQLLILDEPTNHLDAATRDALTEALAVFDGTVLLVSHDRQLLQSCCDRFIIVSKGHLSEFDGDLDDYARLLRTADKAIKTVEEKPIEKPVAKSAPPPMQHSSVVKTQLKQAEKRLAAIDKDIQALQASRSQFEAQMDAPGFYQDPQAASVAKQHASTLEQLEVLEGDWLNTQEKIDELQTQLS